MKLGDRKCLAEGKKLFSLRSVKSNCISEGKLKGPVYDHTKYTR